MSAQHAALRRGLEEVEARIKALDGPAPDRHGDEADRLQALEEHEVQVLGRAALVERQQLILAALVKIDRDEYGRCETCGCPIAAKRLKAVPYAARCVECQAAVELGEEHFRKAAAAAPQSDDVDEGGQG
jgi:DnaK suppressor protein